MRNRKAVSLLAIVLCISMIFALAVPAFAVTQSEIDALQEKKDAVSKERKQAQEKVDALKSEQAGIIEQKKALDERNAFAIEQIKINAEQIELYGQMIEEKALEVEEAKRLEIKQLERYRTRVRAMEEKGNYSFLDLLVQAKSFGELLTLIDDIGEIMKSDRELEDEYIAAREHTEQVKAEYEQYKTELEKKQDELRTEQKELEAQIEEANELILALMEDIEGASEILKQFEDAEDALEAEIDELLAELEKQEKYGSVTGSGNFIWPVSCTYITSGYGTRIHPIYGTERWHAGLDIGCSYGDAIWAADGGSVILSGYNDGGYGNYVMIDHGNGYVTLYGHMSSRAVSYGDYVSQGQVIGYVGSTGASTGPHLHFEIRVNGGTTDPSAYFGGLTFAWDA